MQREVMLPWSRMRRGNEGPGAAARIPSELGRVSSEGTGKDQAQRRNGATNECPQVTLSIARASARRPRHAPSW
jgi:hypothetical protein